MAPVAGDAGGVRTLCQSWGANAAAVHSQSVGFGQAAATIHPSVFAGPAGDRMRTNVSQLQAASAAVAAAYDQVASYLPRVADAIEKAKEAETAERNAAKALSDAEKALTQAQGQLTVANGAVAFGSPLSPTIGPSPTQLAAQAAAQRAVLLAQHQVDLAGPVLQIAQRRFNDDDRYRRSVLAYLTYLCQTEAQIAARQMPNSPPPSSPRSMHNTSWRRGSPAS